MPGPFDLFAAPLPTTGREPSGCKADVRGESQDELSDFENAYAYAVDKAARQYLNDHPHDAFRLADIEVLVVPHGSRYKVLVSQRTEMLVDDLEYLDTEVRRVAGAHACVMSKVE